MVLKPNGSCGYQIHGHYELIINDLCGIRGYVYVFKPELNEFWSQSLNENLWKVTGSCYDYFDLK